MHKVPPVSILEVPATDAALRVEVRPSRDTVFLVLRGELDLATVGVVASEIATLRHAGFKRLVLDLRALEFMDSTGLALIVREHDAGPFAIVPGDGLPRRVLELTGLLDAIPHVRGRDVPLAPAA